MLMEVRMEVGLPMEIQMEVGLRMEVALVKVQS